MSFTQVPSGPLASWTIVQWQAGSCGCPHFGLSGLGFCSAGPGAFGFLTLGVGWATLAGLSTVGPDTFGSFTFGVGSATLAGFSTAGFAYAFGSVLSGFFAGTTAALAGGGVTGASVALALMTSGLVSAPGRAVAATAGFP